MEGTLLKMEMRGEVIDRLNVRSEHPFFTRGERKGVLNGWASKSEIPILVVYSKERRAT